MSEYEEYPDKTLTELREDNEDDELVDDLEGEVSTQIEDTKEGAVLACGAVVFARMFEDDVITLREYIQYIEYLEDWETELEHSPLR